MCLCNASLRHEDDGIVGGYEQLHALHLENELTILNLIQHAYYVRL